MSSVHLVVGNRNVPVTDIRKWTAIDTTRSIGVVWESIMSTHIHHGFPKCTFGIKDAVIAEDGEDNSN
jgi:hypothetical protein